MAQRRMFSIQIMNSARFIKMPIDAQNLYFHLGLRADDDGIVEAFSVMRLIGSPEDNLKLLHAKGFVHVLNDDLVTYITDWKEHNCIRADRKIDSIYKNLLVQIVPDAKLLESRERADRKKEEKKDSNGTSHGQPMDGIGKVSIGKDSIVKKDKYGEFENVLLTKQELEKLKVEYTNYEELIKNMDEAIAIKGYKYKSHYLAIRKWEEKNKKLTPQKPKAPVVKINAHYELPDPNLFLGCD